MKQIFSYINICNLLFNKMVTTLSFEAKANQAPGHHNMTMNPIQGTGKLYIVIRVG